MKRLLFTTRKRGKGFVTIYMVFAFLALIPMAGLAIDLSVLYNVKGKLQAACDAAAIGSGSTIQRSTNMSDPATIANIQDVAGRFFNANYNAGFWGSSQISYSATPSENANTKVRTIVITASEKVPLLFLRVTGASAGVVGASATISIRFVTMMIVVDRSGSVTRAGANTDIQNALTTFVANASTSYLVDGRDIVGMGSFGGNWHADFAATSTFRSGSPNIATAIANIPFGNNGTNTAEGLSQAYTDLKALNQTGALNVIVLLTDGRPSAFSVTLNMQSTCTTKGNKTGFITAIVGQDWPPLPPQTQGGAQGSSTIYNMGLFGLTGTDGTVLSSTAGCKSYSNQENINQDIANFPTADIYGNSTTGPYYQGEGTSMSDPRALRYSAFNAADNMATIIRQDTTIKPTLFVIGLNEPPAGGEPLDADWLARVANDPGYVSTTGGSVFQTGQTPGMYFNVTAAGLNAAFAEIASQILRLSQ